MRRYRLAQQESLHLTAALRPNRIELLLGFNALGCCRNTKSAGKHGYGSHDVERAGVVCDVTNKRPVNLDLVEGKALQVAERGIAGTEIVHGDANADLAQPAQYGQGGFAVL